MTRARRLARWVAVWFGCGLSPVAPGTVGTLGAVPLYLLVRPRGPVLLLAVAVLVTGVGVVCATIVAADEGTRDPQIVVIDEVAGFLVTMLAAPPSLEGLLLGFALFRVFDIVKPWPARRAERLHGGWGIVLDDVVAGLWGAGVLLILRGLRVA